MRTTTIALALSLGLLACETTAPTVTRPHLTTGGEGGGGGTGGDAAVDAGTERDAADDAPAPDAGCACPHLGCFYLTESMRVCNPCEPNTQWSQHENDSCAERCCDGDDPGGIMLAQQACTWMNSVPACEPAGDFVCKLFNGSTCGRCWSPGIQDNRCGVATPGCWMDGCSWTH